MEYIEQGIDVLFENKINYQTLDQMSEEIKKSKIRNINEFFNRIKSVTGISLIIGSNGIGKTYLLEELKKQFKTNSIKINFIKFKDYDSLDSIIKVIKLNSEFIIFDGLDEINSEIQNEVIDCILSIKNKNIIISSRKDFIQKRNLFDAKYNIYEIRQLEDYKIDNILKINGLNKDNYKKIYNLLKTPRFLTHLLDVKDIVKGKKIINKFDLLEMIINKHFDVVNQRASIKIETNIHKKILQSLALVMMMTGKSNMTMEEFTVFLSNINHLDIKSYILNKDIIESFLNNQNLLNYGDLISFENKEIMEFLAAKEIYDNNFSNKDLFDIVTLRESEEINVLWFNTISYLVSKSRIYYELIINYIFNNLHSHDNLLDLLLNLDFNFENDKLISKNIKKIVFQYTKLYQYMPFYENTNNISKILDVDIKICFKNLTDILIKQKIEKSLTDFDSIFINNTFSCINYLLEKNLYNKTELRRLKNYLLRNEQYYIKSDSFKVRYLYVYLKIIETDEVDKLLEKNVIDKRLLSIFLYDKAHLNKLKKIDRHLNNYILNCKNKFDDHFMISENLIIDYINENYDTTRLKRLVNSIKDDKSIASFIHFLNSNNLEGLWLKLSKKSIVDIIYHRIIKELLDENAKSNQDIREEIIFDRRKGDALEKLVEICVKYKYLSIESLNDINPNSNYTTEYMKALIIKVFLSSITSLEEIYTKIIDKKSIFNVWRLDLDNEIRTKLESNIKALFPTDYVEYQKILVKYKDKDFIKVEEYLNKITSSNNIYYKIVQSYDLVKNDNYYNIITSDIILRNTLKSISREIENHIINIDIKKMIVKFTKNNSYILSYDIQYYSQAICVLMKMGYDINKYNEYSVILLNTNLDQIEPSYSERDYKALLTYVNKKTSKGYIRLYLHDIIKKLKKYDSNVLFETIFKWFDYMSFNEYQINSILSFILDNINSLNDDNIKKLKKFRNNKVCQDILIELGFEKEIKNRIDYIKKNLVFEGDIMSIEENGNFEYSSGTYINCLAKIGYKNKKYIFDLLSYMFRKYNEGDYYQFSKYILNMVAKYINNVGDSNVNDIIDFIVTNERNNNNRYLYEMCNAITMLRTIDYRNIIQVINQYNSIITNNDIKIYSYDDLYEIVKEVLQNNIFEDILRMQFLEIFRDKNTKKINPLKEETYQFLIGYELTRILNNRGFSTKVVYESTAFDKKRNDIQLVTEGFIQDIVIETKLSNNRDISNEESIKTYIKETLKKYTERFNSPKILFVIINQSLTPDTFQKRISTITKNSNNIVDAIPIQLGNYFK